MEFAQYLKKCRENFGLPQEELARELYLHSEEEFSEVDTSVLSKMGAGDPSSRIPAQSEDSGLLPDLEQTAPALLAGERS